MDPWRANRRRVLRLSFTKSAAWQASMNRSGLGIRFTSGFEECEVAPLAAIWSHAFAELETAVREELAEFSTTDLIFFFLQVRQ
jgi:hypothetical protein